MGYALAHSAAAAGWEVTLISGPVALSCPDCVTRISVMTGQQMLDAVLEHFPTTRLLLKCAAVCDFRPKSPAAAKVSKKELEMTVEFEPTADILGTVSALKQPGQTVVGFAAQTHDLLHYAREKLHSKNLDYIAANKVGGSDAGSNAFESDQNTLHLMDRQERVRVLGPGDKTSVATRLLEQLAYDGIRPD
jgi:phosphopantothenoylcysteine decarboxylase/phosphopantothenate--cysteine ligase